MEEQQVGWIAAIIIGGIAGWLAEQFMKSQMGLVMNIVLGIIGAAVASTRARGEVTSARPRGCRGGVVMSGPDINAVACTSLPTSRPRAALLPCAVPLSFLRVLPPTTHRAKACVPCRANGDAHEFLGRGSGAFRKQQKMRKRLATPATSHGGTKARIGLP